MSLIVLIDFSSVLHPIFHMESTNPDPNATSTKVVARIRALASGQPHVAICCDKGPYFRKDIAPDYKAGRVPIAELLHQGEVALDVLRGDGFPVWAVPGFEADDLIASATVRAVTFKDHSVLICSSDKDLLQMVGQRVTVKKLALQPGVDNADWDVDRVLLKFGVLPSGLCDWLSLVGDASDNVKGAKGIGAKTATALLDKYGNLEDLYAHLGTNGSSFTPATAKSLREFQGRLETVRSLIRLRTDVPLPFADVFRERVPADAAPVVFYDGPETIAVFTGEDNDTMDETAPSAASAAPAEPVSPVEAVPAAPRPAAAPVDPMASLAASVQPQVVPQPIARPEPASPAGLAVRDAEVLPPPSGEFSMQLEPRSLREASLLAVEIHKSRLFSAYGTWQGVLTTVLAGRELGMQAMASLRAFHIIDNKPTMSADLIRALVLKSGQAEYFRCTERTPEKATFLTKRNGDPEVSLTYTLAEAQVAGLVKPGSGWAKNPADMCVARASAKLARLVYADIVFNMYAPEEFE